MHVTLVITLLMGTWVAWTLLSLWRNYQIARTIKLPIILSPVGTINPLWIILYKLLYPQIIPLLKSLPIGNWPRCTYTGWQYDEKYQIHAELGPAFVLCTPSFNEVFVADPDAAHHILHKRKDFIKPAIMYDAMNAFGVNLDSAEGETWQRHRKITAPNFNEKISASVWSESTRQARQMLEEWTTGQTKELGTTNIVEDTASLALNVLTFAGFGLRYDFNPSKTHVEPPHTLSYRDALSLILRNFTLLAVFPMSWLGAGILPAKIRAVAHACAEFKLYMRETVAREKAAVAAAVVGESQNLLGALVRASQAETTHGLTDDELYGNIFIYNLAGHETTANTIATATAYLAAHPRWQAWLHAELDAVLPPPTDKDDGWAYETTFPALRRCQAVMLETLRLHGSLPFMPKATGAFPQPLVIAGRQHVVPPGTFVVIDSQALHCDPTTWGDDALVWRPDRWIAGGADKGGNGEVEGEVLVDRPPRPGAFVAWADGPRVCPGRKFSQVEFAGVLAVVFRRHRVVPCIPGKSREAAAEVLKGVIEDSGISAVTLQMRRPGDVALRWEER